MTAAEVRRMKAAELAPFIETYRIQDWASQRHVRELAASIKRLGYRPGKHGGMSGDTRTYPPSFPIELVHEDGRSYLMEGNHRAQALNDVGYARTVPVLVRDLRTRPAPTRRRSR
jgi:hypothetical protein